MSRPFASAGDLAEKPASFTEGGHGLCAFTARGDPNAGRRTPSSPAAAAPSSAGRRSMKPYDEAQGIDTPRIWTAARDAAMWDELQA
ncbi:hypothetical protein BH23PSE1_BH23PSE1_04950 [soil metagenome]